MPPPDTSQSPSPESPETAQPGAQIGGSPKSGRTPSRSPRGHPRKHTFVLRMSDDERGEIQDQADRLNISSADYIRARIFGYRLPSPRGVIDDEAYQVLSRLSVTLRNIGGLLNQLAHAHHLGFQISANATQSAMQELRSCVDDLRSHLVNMAPNFEQSEGKKQGMNEGAEKDS